MKTPIVDVAVGGPEHAYVCLEFTNTVNMHGSAEPEETLLTYGDLVDWAEQAGVLRPGEAADLLRAAKAQPVLAMHALQEAHDLREAIYRIVLAAVDRRDPAKADLDLLNKVLAQAMRELRIGYREGGYVWLSEPERGKLHRFLPRVAHSAAELLTSGQMERVGVCADEDGCGWLFFDTSRNRSRRWCDINSCGNRAKARRHYARSKPAS